MTDIRLSRNFFLSEFLRSQTAARLGIDNTPPARVIENLRRLCQQALQPLRDALGPVFITSGYRSPALNEAIGGSRSSQHRDGLAADLVVSGVPVPDVCAWLRDNITYDQLIHEFGDWTHVSVAPPDRRARLEVLTALRTGAGVEYRRGLPA